MMVFDVRADIRDVEKALTSLGRDLLPKATADSLNAAARFSERKLIEEMDRVFDRPTTFAKNSMVLKLATPQRQIAELHVKDRALKSVPAMKWLRAEIYGGQRRRKAFEALLIRAGRMPADTYATPTKFAPLDAHGNVQRGVLNTLLSDLQARRDEKQNATARSWKRRRAWKNKPAIFYFSTYPLTPGVAHLKPGIYRRQKGSTWIAPVFLFVKRARYRKRWAFYEVADQVARMRWPIEFGLAMRRALRQA